MSARRRKQSGAGSSGVASRDRATSAESSIAWRLTSRARLEADPGGANGFLLDTYSAAMCVCNDTAWTLLRMLKRGASVERLARELVARHDAKRGVARSDALGFVRRLRRMGLVDGHR